MRGERGNHTLQPTALAHEAYLRLADSSSAIFRDRSAFLAAAARVMRHVLVDHARSHLAEKRGAGAVQVTLDENLAAPSDRTAEVLALDEALGRLAKFDPRQARILEMHFFAGMTFEEVAEVLAVSPRTIKRDWSMARAWLRHELSPRR